MEDVKEFFDKVLEYVIENAPKAEHTNLKKKCPSLGNFDFDTTLKYVNNIANKLFTLSEKDRAIYANLIVKSIDLHNIEEMLVDREEEENVVICKREDSAFSDVFSVEEAQKLKKQGELRTQTHCFYKIQHTDKYVETDCVFSDCRFFVQQVWELFCEFGIDLRKIIAARTDLQYDYEYLGHLPFEYIYYKNAIPINKSYTAARQVIAIRAVLSEIGIDSLNTDKTLIASFMQFVTGRQSYSKPQDTTLYKLLNRDVYKEKEIRSYNQDCEYVAVLFDKVGAITIAQKIRNSQLEDI